MNASVLLLLLLLLLSLLSLLLLFLFLFLFPPTVFSFFSSLDTEEEKRQEIEKILQKADEVEVRPVVAGSLYVHCYFGMKKTLRTLAFVVPPLLPPYRTQRIYTLI